MGFPIPPPTNVELLHHCGAQDSTTEQVSIRYNCRHGVRQIRWAYIDKAETKVLQCFLWWNEPVMQG